MIKKMKQPTVISFFLKKLTRRGNLWRS